MYIIATVVVNKESVQQSLWGSADYRQIPVSHFYSRIKPCNNNKKAHWITSRIFRTHPGVKSALAFVQNIHRCIFESKIVLSNNLNFRESCDLRFLSEKIQWLWGSNLNVSIEKEFFILLTKNLHQSLVLLSRFSIKKMTTVTRISKRFMYINSRNRLNPITDFVKLLKI